MARGSTIYDLVLFIYPTQGRRVNVSVSETWLGNVPPLFRFHRRTKNNEAGMFHYLEDKNQEDFLAWLFVFG